MPISSRLAALESAYLAARDARDRLGVAVARGLAGDASELEPEAAATQRRLREALAAFDDGGGSSALGPDDTRAVAAMRAGIETAFDVDTGPPASPRVSRADCDDVGAWSAVIDAGGAALASRLEGCFGAIAGDLDVGGERLARPQVLGRLATEPDATARRRLFLALQPLWRAVDGDAGRSSPYRALIRGAAARWAAGGSPIAANERALGIAPGDVERWAVATLDAWRETVTAPARSRGEPATEPWDWWWQAGEADRAVRRALPLERAFDIHHGSFASLGVDFDALHATFDTSPRPDRPTIAVAFTDFGARPAQRPNGTWSPGAPTVLATYVDGGLGELTELIHEGGHACHIGAIRTRPAFADWPDSDALTEALAEVVALDTAEPAWQARWMPDADRPPEATMLRCRYAEVMLDVAWALFEIRLLDDLDRSPNEVWTSITSSYLGLAPHPEWSWWAMRGQLVQEPGYMANYQVGAVLATDVRAAIRAARGDWTAGDPGWYSWVSDRVYRFGLERSSGEVLRELLGRPPDVTALLHEIERARA